MIEIRDVAKDQLKSFVESIDGREEDKGALSGDVREVYSEL